MYGAIPLLSVTVFYKVVLCTKEVPYPDVRVLANQNSTDEKKVSSAIWDKGPDFFAQPQVYIWFLMDYISRNGGGVSLSMSV